MDRRAKMAEDKIAAAERAAIAEVRARAADAAAKAAGAADRRACTAPTPTARCVDRTIAGLGRAQLIAVSSSRATAPAASRERSESRRLRSVLRR